MSKPTAKQIIESIPVRFRPEKATDYNTVFHFDIAGEGGGQFTIVINNGSCQQQVGLHADANCTVTTSADTYTAMETGETNPQMALMMGKVKVSNLAEMIKFSKCFKRFKARQPESSQPSRKPKQGPLVGLKILDFTHLLPGPLATMLMADMGAEVIKIEDPDSPDAVRNFTPFDDGVSTYYKALNRSKRSLSVNYRSPEGLTIIKILVEQADIVIEQFRPGVMANIGLGYEELKTINPKLIYVSITGYGQTGPYAKKAGHDLNYIAYSGLLHLTGDGQGKPTIPGGQIADVAAGSYMAVNACLAALYSRTNTNLGQHVDVAMLDCVMPLISMPYAYYNATNDNIKDGKYELTGSRANYNVYQCADGKWIALGSLEPRFWNAFCDGVNKPEWKEKIIENRDKQQALYTEVATVIKAQPLNYWLDLNKKFDCCLTPILDMSELAEDPQIIARNMVLTERDIAGFGIPLKFSDTKPEISWASPELGEDSDAILIEAGYTDDEIDGLSESGVVKI